MAQSAIRTELGTPSIGAAWTSLIVVYVVWGSTYLAIRVADESLPPLLMAGVRYVLAGLILLPFVLKELPEPDAAIATTSLVPAPATSGRRGPRRGRSLPSKAQLAGCSITGILMLTGGNGGVSWAERTVPSGLAALLVASVPLWMVVADRVISRAVASPLAIIGLVIGIAGVGVLAGPGSHHSDAVGVMVILLAALSWAVGSLLSRRLAHPASSLATTALQMLAGGLTLIVLAACTGEIAHFQPAAVSLRSWLSMVYLIGPGSILALTCYTVALQRLPTSTVATYAYVNPIVAVLLGWAILNEHVSSTTIAGGLLVVIAVALVITEQRRRSNALISAARDEHVRQ